MKNNIDIDSDHSNQPYLFSSDDLDKVNIRVRPSELARLIGCSKQAVSLWVRDGKIILGSDGRVNPALAMSQLLRSTNPKLLRAKTLKPLIKVIQNQEKQIEALKIQIKNIQEDVDFHEGASTEFLDAFHKIKSSLILEQPSLESLTNKQLLTALSKFIEKVMFSPYEEELIINFVDLP